MCFSRFVVFFHEHNNNVFDAFVEAEGPPSLSEKMTTDNDSGKGGMRKHRGSPTLQMGVALQMGVEGRRRRCTGRNETTCRDCSRCTACYHTCVKASALLCISPSYVPPRDPATILGTADRAASVRAVRRKFPDAGPVRRGAEGRRIAVHASHTAEGGTVPPKVVEELVEPADARPHGVDQGEHHHRGEQELQGGGHLSHVPDWRARTAAASVVVWFQARVADQVRKGQEKGGGKLVSLLRSKSTIGNLPGMDVCTYLNPVSLNYSSRARGVGGV